MKIINSKNPSKTLQACLDINYIGNYLQKCTNQAIKHHQNTH
jgi:hypothetical protein